VKRASNFRNLLFYEMAASHEIVACRRLTGFIRSLILLSSLCHLVSSQVEGWSKKCFFTRNRQAFSVGGKRRGVKDVRVWTEFGLLFLQF